MDETTMTMGISPARAERGRWVYSAWKHLRNFDQQAVAPFEATSLAGKTCDLLGRMRQLAPYGPAALRPLLADAGITRLEFKNTLLPLLETLGHLPGLTARRHAQQGGGDGPGTRLIRVPPGNLAPWPGRARGGAPAGKVQGNGHQGLDDGALAGKA